MIDTFFFLLVQFNSIQLYILEDTEKKEDIFVFSFREEDAVMVS